MKTLAKRLAHALSERKKTPAELARATGKTESAVSQWLSGETKSMRSDSLMATCALLSCNAQWLASGKGDSGLDGKAQAATELDERRASKVVTLEDAMETIGAHLDSVEGYDKPTAIALFTTLANSPRMHGLVAAGIRELMPQARAHPEKQIPPAQKTHDSRAA